MFIEISGLWKYVEVYRTRSNCPWNMVSCMTNMWVLPVLITLVKSTQNPFQYHHCIVETRIAKNLNCIIYQERKTRQARTSRTKPFCSAAEWLREALQESCNNAGCSSSKFSGAPMADDIPGDSRFRTLSPGLQIRVQNLPDNRRSLPFLVDSTFWF